MTLSLKHIQVRDFIVKFQDEHGRHPSHKIIMADCAIKSSRETWEILEDLRRAGELSGPVFVVQKTKEAGV
jgi:hypothetical protein